MTRRIAVLAWTVSAIAAALQAQQIRTIQIGTSDTTVRILPAPHAPGVLGLSSAAGRSWRTGGSTKLIDHVEVEGRRVSLHWDLNSAAGETSTDRIRLVYESTLVRLRLAWTWRRRAAFGPLEHSIRITNSGDEALWIPLQDSLDLAFSVPQSDALEHLWVEKGAGGPSDIGTHRASIGRRYAWSGESSTYAHPRRTEPREIIPYVLVQRRDPGQEGWFAGIEFSGRTRMRVQRNGASLGFTAGLNDQSGTFRFQLKPGESFETPEVFVGSFEGGADVAGNLLHRWVRQVINNPKTLQDSSYPLTVSNSWGSGMAIDEAQAMRMMREASALGLEMFHLDAGWFRGVGDWYPDATKFPNGLTPVARYAHERGLRFGLWVDWAQASLDHEPGSLYIHDRKVRDWLPTDPPPGWKPGEAFKGITIDLGVPAAHDWAQAELERITREYHLDMLEHDGYVVAQGCDRGDHPHAPPDPKSTTIYQDSGFLWVDSANSTDVSYRATRSYYGIHDELRRNHPDLLLEICNDGGRMIDYGSAAHGDYFSISDAYDPVANRRAFYDASYALPPAMLESYVASWPTPTLDTFLYMLRSGMMGWFTLMLDPSTFTPKQHDAARDAIAVYKTRLRPLIRTADLFHISERPDGVHWDGVEYFNAESQQGAVFAFHGSSAEETEHVFKLNGLRSDNMYRLSFEDHSAEERAVSGRDLMRVGLRVSLPHPNSSEIIFLASE